MRFQWTSCIVILFIAFSQISLAQEMDLTLRLRGRIAMEELADNVTNNASPRYQQFYTPDEIRELAGPTDKTYSRTLQQLKKKGFQITGEDKTHLFVTVRAPQSLVERVFNTSLEVLDATNGIHREAKIARVPTDLTAINSVIGLSNVRQSHHLHKIFPASPWLGDPNSGIMPDEIKDLYGFDPIYKAGVNGVGQQIAIATYDDFHDSDVQMYWAFQDVKPVPKVDSVHFNGTPQMNDDDCSETELDAEFSGMIAPGAQIHVFSSAHNNDQGEVQLFTAILDDNRAKVVSYSWGDCEDNVSAQHFNDMNQIFARAVAQGVNIMIASGDWGSYGCPDDKDHPKINPGWPASDPYIVSVGGTTITGGGSGSVKEEAWDSTGGGVSTVFPLPSWQQGFSAPFLKRSFPDVAFNADPNTGQTALVHYQNKMAWLQFGGTSISAPQWAGFLALVNSARGNRGPIGYINPIIYGFSPAQRAQTFNDVKKGSNGAYKAGLGWDATTGFGSMKASSLFNVLAAY